jgi:hypothetical protein
MRLVDLLPRWLTPNVFAFLCPHCQNVFLTCKNVAMDTWQQREIVWRHLLGWDGNEAHPPAYPVDTVLCKEEMAWNFPSSVPFDTLTVTPSLNAGAAGHWHGNITQGEIVGGI